MASDGTNLSRLTTHSDSDGHPSWSPDWSAHGLDSDQDFNRDLYVMELDGTN